MQLGVEHYECLVDMLGLPPAEGARQVGARLGRRPFLWFGTEGRARAALAEAWRRQGQQLVGRRQIKDGHQNKKSPAWPNPLRRGARPLWVRAPLPPTATKPRPVTPAHVPPDPRCCRWSSARTCSLLRE